LVVLTKHIHKRIFILSISFRIFNKDFHVQKTTVIHAKREAARKNSFPCHV